MGCDIHVHIEIKVRGRWLHYSTPSVARDYALFATLARTGRRPDIDPIVENRGVPADASEVTQLCFWDCGTDGHSHSYLHAHELGALQKRLDALAIERGHCGLDYDLEHGVLNTYLLGNSLRSVPQGEIQDLRIVFWFDN